MKRKKIIVGLVCSAFTLCLTSCDNTESNDELQNVAIIDSVLTDTVVEVSNTMDYSVPTPNELFQIVKLQGGEQQSNLVNPLSNIDNYVDTKSKAINFGIYSADLAYLSCFGIGVDFLKYFSRIESLGEELGISGAFDEEMIDRIENNDGDTDSLFAISNQTYYDSYFYLEENEKGLELSLIMAGGYLESLYIICNLVDEYDAENPVVKKIGDQKIVLENLVDFIVEYANNEDVNAVINDLMDLNDVFESNMELEEEATSISSDEDGTLMLTGGGAFTMNETAFNAVKEKANELRDNYTK